MASAPPVPPPPGAQTPTSPVGASPASEQPSPALQRSSQQVLTIVQATRALAQQYPEAAPTVAKINDLLRELMMKIAQRQQPGEPAAPPIGA